MTNAAPVQDEGIVPVEPTAYNSFVTSLKLLAISFVKIGGERRAIGNASETRFELVAGFQIEDSTVHYRFDVVGHLTDPSASDFGDVSASVVVTVTAPVIPDRACLEQFGGTSAAMMAHPYLREGLASTALRLGFPGVLLPAITQHPDAETKQ